MRPCPDIQGQIQLTTDSSSRAVEGSSFVAQDLRLAALDHALGVMERCEEAFGDDGLKILGLCLIAGNQYTLHLFDF